MKVSEIQVNDVIRYLNLDGDEYNPDNIHACLDAAKSFIKSYTGLTYDAIDNHEDFYIVVMVLCQDMNDNRSMYVDNKNLNRVVETILGMHCVNLL